MKPINIICATAIFIGLAFTSSKLVTWKVKEGYRIKHVESGGLFTGLKAEILFDEDKPGNSKFKTTIDAGSLDAGGGTEEGKKILETDKYPTISFESTKIVKTAPGQYDAIGNLTLKGVTKEIKFPFNFDSKKGATRYPVVEKETFGGTFTISTKDFNVDMGKTDKCTIELLIPVTR